jgi:fucose permease
MQPGRVPSGAALIALGFTSFVAFGVVLVLLGANQADVARSLGLDLAGTGLLAAALSAGLGLGVVLAGPLVDRHPRGPTWVAALLVSALALSGFDAGMGFPRAVACSALVGLGIGVYDTLISTLVAERYRERAARPMALVHAGATLGAVTCPLLVDAVAPRWGWAASFHWAAAAHLLLAGAVLAARPPPPPRPVAGRSADSGLRAVLRPALLPLAVAGFAYVGVETALTLFAVPYAGEALGLAPSSGRAGISAFWAGLLAGRLGLLALPVALDARVLAVSGALGAALIAGGAALGVRPIELHFAAAGLALGGVFPLLVALAGLRFPDARGSAVGAVTGAGALGGFALPWLHGAVGDAAGAAVAVGSLSLWAAALAAAALFARRR